jgi:hypothetical protein
VVFDDPPKSASTDFDDLWTVLNSATSLERILPRLATKPNDSGWIATCNSPLWNVLGDDSAGAHDGVAPDMYARQKNDPGADPNIVTDGDDLLRRRLLVHHGDIYSVEAVIPAEDHHFRSHEGVLADMQLSTNTAIHTELRMTTNS